MPGTVPMRPPDNEKRRPGRGRRFGKIAVLSGVDDAEFSALGTPAQGGAS